MEILVEPLRWTQTAAFLAVGAWSLRNWSRRGDEPSRWLAATFGSLAALVLVVRLSELLEGVVPAEALELVGRTTVALLLLFPYLLLRFLDAFEQVASWVHRATGWVVVALAAASFVVTFPEPGEPWNGPFAVYVGTILATWLTVLPHIGFRFWRAGRAQPALARRRLQLLGAAVLALSASVVLLAASDAPDDALTQLNQAFGIVAALLLLTGFAPPRWLRQLWRQPEEEAMHAAALQLMATVDATDVAAVLTPHLRSVVAARGVALIHRGELIGLEGVGAEDVAAVGGGELDPGSLGSDALRQPLRHGAILVWTDRYTPFFGIEELQVLQRIGLLADLALHRAELLASEQAARSDLADTNAELEAFVYSASHDLKSPLIAILSYVDLLVEEHRDRLDDEAQWYLDRLVTNGRYMESLIGDLLELSRVGRTMMTPERVELAELVEDVATALQGSHPGASVTSGHLPVLWVNGTRMRQLLQNLIENAVKHGPEQVRVEVTAETPPDGGVVLVVRDDGPGIPAAYRERVFGVFERLEAQDATSGTGIGLAICRKVVESLGGRIWLGDPDAGAEFRIHLPATVLAHDAASAEEVPA